MRVLFIDCPVDILTHEETLERVMEAIREKRKYTHTALNVAKLVNMRSSPILKADVSASDIIGIDGMGIVWGARLVGISAPERVSGIDLMQSIMSECARLHYRPYLLGATARIAKAAAENAKRKYPGLEIAGVRDGYFNPDDEEAIVEDINASGADCLFVGMQTPRKEHFLAVHRQAIKVPFVMGVGGSLDVLAGKVARAPFWVQTIGLEWLFRVAQEPRRLFLRYARTNTLFAALISKELVMRCMRRPAKEAHVDK